MHRTEKNSGYKKKFGLLGIFIIACILLEILLYVNRARLVERRYSVQDGILYQFSLQNKKLLAQGSDPNVILPRINMLVGSISIKCKNSVDGARGQIFYRHGSEPFTEMNSVSYEASSRDVTLELSAVQYVSSLRLDLTNSSGDVIVCQDVVLNPPIIFQLNRPRLVLYAGLFLIIILYLFQDVRPIRLVREKIFVDIEKHPTFIFLSFFIIPFLITVIYLLAFYPGVLSFDSINQWDQLSQFKFSNWHPAYHTILMWLITRIWYSPASVALLQILIYSLVLGYGLYTFKNELGVPYSLLIFLDIAISINPINGMLVITLWKDVLYSILVLLLTIYIFKLINSHGTWITYKHNWIYFGLTIANISLLRHNGFPVGFGTLLICMVVFRYYKYFGRALLISVAFFVLITGPLYRIFNVDKSYSQSIGVVFIHPIAAQINAGTKLTRSERGFLDGIFSLKEGWPYSCYDATVLFYKGVNFQPVQKFPMHAAKIFYMLALRNPMVTINHFICLSSFVWEIEQPNNVQLETIYTSNMDVSHDKNWGIYQNLVTQKSKIPSVKDLILQIISYSYSIDPRQVLWRPAIYFYLFVIVVFIYSLMNKNKSIFVLLAPVLTQSLVIASTAQLQALRYQYPIYLVSMLFSLPLFYDALSARGFNLHIQDRVKSVP